MKRNQEDQSTPADQDLIDAERELNQLRAGERSDEIYDKMEAVEAKIYALKPATMIGGAIKLRLLCDPVIGLQISNPTDEQMVAIRHVLELAEREEKLRL
jgi:hypothetical protein